MHWSGMTFSSIVGEAMYWTTVNPGAEKWWGGGGGGAGGPPTFITVSPPLQSIFIP